MNGIVVGAWVRVWGGPYAGTEGTVTRDGGARVTLHTDRIPGEWEVPGGEELELERGWVEAY